jgi:hypothetical protein
MKQTQEKFEETKRIIISRKSKDSQYNGQKKKGKKCLTFKKIVKIETSLHCCACPKPGPAFTTSYVMVFLVFSELR